MSNFAKFIKAFLKWLNLNISRSKLYILDLLIECFKMMYCILCSMSLTFFEFPEWPKFRRFRENRSLNPEIKVFCQYL